MSKHIVIAGRTIYLDISDELNIFFKGFDLFTGEEAEHAQCNASYALEPESIDEAIECVNGDSWAVILGFHSTRWVAEYAHSYEGTGYTQVDLCGVPDERIIEAMEDFKKCLETNT